MKLAIKDHEVEFKAGIRFLEELDKRYKMERDGFKVDFGLNQLYINFSMNSLPTLKFALWAGTRTDKNYKPTLEDVEEFLEAQEDVFKVLEQVKEEVRESNMTKKDWAELEKNTKAEQKRMKAQEEIMETIETMKD